MADVSSSPVPIPERLLAQARLGEDWAGWLQRLPALTTSVLEEWELQAHLPAMHGFCSLVVPVTTKDGRSAVLKVALPDDESEHEHLALQRWQGNGAVRLLRADPRRRVLLLERLRQRDLTDLDDVAACEVVAELYRRLHVAAPPQLIPLARYVRRWTDAMVAQGDGLPVPRRLVTQAAALARTFLTDEDSAGTLVHTDLHYENVLAGDREPWLVIDPKPVSGDPHYEVAPLLWNRWPELVASGRVRDGVRRRFHTVVDVAGLDEERARDWVVVRAMHDASWAVADARRARRTLTGQERDWITTMVTVAKAVQ